MRTTIKSDLQSLWLIATVLWSLQCLLSGCTTAPLKVHEVHYYRVATGTNVNYFRLTVDADSRLGVAEYRSGWFPARSVDSVFGDASQSGGEQALRMRTELEKQIDAHIMLTTTNWLNAAAATNVTPEELERLAEARKRVLSYPLDGPLPGSGEMDYNPITGLVKLHSDEKLIFMLASNPDEIIGKIANFSQSEQTSLTIHKFTDTLLQRQTDQQAARSATEAVKAKRDALIFENLATSLSVITNQPSLSKDAAIFQIDTLLSLLEASRP